VLLLATLLFPWNFGTQVKSVPKSKSKSKLWYDRRSLRQSVLVSSSNLGLTTRFLLLSDSCGFVNVVCLLQLLLVLATLVILGYESRGNRDHILLSQIRDSPNLEGKDPVFISPRNRVAQLYPQTLGSLFVASYDSQGYGGGIRTHLHAGIPVFSHISERTTHRKHSPSIAARCRPHRKHVSRVRLRVNLSVSSTGRGADYIENTASSIVACCTVVKKLLPGNA
jgi:hypothetical protein